MRSNSHLADDAIGLKSTALHSLANLVAEIRHCLMLALERPTPAFGQLVGQFLKVHGLWTTNPDVSSSKLWTVHR